MVFHGLEFYLLLASILVIFGVFKQPLIRKWAIVIGSFVFLAYGDLNSLYYLLFVAITTYLSSIIFKKKPQFPAIPFVVLIVAAIFSSKFFTNSFFYLPLGISFYALQAISLIIDQKKKNEIEDYSFLDVLLYLSFFPQLIAGPICRAQQLMPQLQNNLTLKKNNFKSASNDILEGLFLKLIIADYLGPKVTHFFNNPGIVSGFSYWLIFVIGYAFYIYCDFFSYSKMAIGFGKILGIDLPINFDFPYFAKNLKEFWRRWHISLSSWLKDYIYIPCGGFNNFAFSIIVTFVISAFWHGVGLNFLVWSLIHAFGLLVSKHFEKSNLQILNRPLMYFCILTGWIFFAAKDLTTAHFILKQMFSKPTNLQFSSISSILYFSLLGITFDFLLRSQFYGNLKETKIWNFIWPVFLVLILILKAPMSTYIYYRF